MDKPTEGFRQLFSSIFRSELNAIEARRRRYRIEQTLGSLPEAPKSLPRPQSVEPVAAAPSTLTLDELRKLQADTEEARRALLKIRRPLPKPPPEETTPSPTSKPPEEPPPG